MLYSPVGDLNIANIVLGGALFGGSVEEKTAFTLMDTYVDRGGNCVDTARLYANGNSEITIGKWLRKNPGKRDSVIISTKGGHPALDTMHVSRLNQRELEQDLDSSLQALGVDCIDLYWLHRDDTTQPPEEILAMMNTFIKKGKIRHLGVSNWHAQRIQRANAFAEKEGLSPIVGSQIQWSLAHPTPGVGDPTLVLMDEAEHTACVAAGVPVFAFSSQGAGIFSILHKGGMEALTNHHRKTYLNEVTLKRYEVACRLAKAHKVPIAAIVLAYIYADPCLSGHALIGPVSTDLLLDSIAHAELMLTPEEIGQLNGM